MSTQKYKGEDIVQNAMGGFKTPDGKFVYGSLVLTPTAMVYHDKKLEDVCPLVNIEKVELVKGGPVFAVMLKAGGEKQYRTGNAKGWVAKLEEWIERAARAPPAPVASEPAQEAQLNPLNAPVYHPVQPVPSPVPVPVPVPQPVPSSSPALPRQQPAANPPGTFVGSTYAPVVAPSVQNMTPPPVQRSTAPAPGTPAQSQPIVEVILAGLEPRSPAGNEFRLPIHEWAQVWAVVSAMIVMAPANESISKDVAIQVLLPSTGFQVAGLDHRVAAQIIETALLQQQQKTIDIVAVTYSKIDFGLIYDDMKGVPLPPFDAEKFLDNCARFVEFAKDNLGFTVTIAKPAPVVKPATPVATASIPGPAASSARREIQFCTQCGKQNSIDARFCVRCGKPMKLA
ncbi:MAG: zinc ribbon domain-containing protein [Candidatus Sigynarchaeota archaeon]